MKTYQSLYNQMFFNGFGIHGDNILYIKKNNYLHCAKIIRKGLMIFDQYYDHSKKKMIIINQKRYTLLGPNHIENQIKEDSDDFQLFNKLRLHNK